MHKEYFIIIMEAEIGKLRLQILLGTNFWNKSGIKSQTLQYTATKVSQITTLKIVTLIEHLKVFRSVA